MFWMIIPGCLTPRHGWISSWGLRDCLGTNSTSDKIPAPFANMSGRLIRSIQDCRHEHGWKTSTLPNVSAQSWTGFFAVVKDALTNWKLADFYILSFPKIWGQLLVILLKFSDSQNKSRRVCWRACSSCRVSTFVLSRKNKTLFIQVTAVSPAWWQMDEIKHHTSIRWPSLPRYRCCPALFFPSSLIHPPSSPGNEWKLSLSSLLLLGCSLECWVSRKNGVKYPNIASVVNWQPLPRLALLKTGQEVCVQRGRKLLKCGALWIQAEESWF